MDAGVAMPEQSTGGADAGPALRFLAGKVNWLTGRARPAGQRRLVCRRAAALADVAAGLVLRVPGRPVSRRSELRGVTARPAV